MNFYKIGIPSIVLISTLFSCKNSTETVQKENTIIENTVSSKDSIIQIDTKGFHKSLSLHNIKFDISTIGEGSLKQLDIQPYGLKKDTNKITLEIAGSVTNAEIDDLNSDGFPEILIYITSAGSGSYGTVIGYSVNNGKSMSQIYFPSISDNPEAKKGYMGHDEFAIVNKALIQRFKTYKEGDINSEPTGNIHEIHYKLVDGEASRKFVVDSIKEFPGK